MSIHNREILSISWFWSHFPHFRINLAAQDAARPFSSRWAVECQMLSHLPPPVGAKHVEPFKFLIAAQILVQNQQVVVLVGMANLPFDASGLGGEWENVDSIRTRLREGKSLVIEGSAKSTDGTIQECVQNIDLLLPSLGRLFISNLKLPGVGALRDEVELVYTKCQRKVSESQIDDGAWDIRKLLKLVKRKANRSDPSLDIQILLARFSSLVDFGGVP